MILLKHVSALCKSSLKSNVMLKKLILNLEYMYSEITNNSNSWWVPRITDIVTHFMEDLRVFIHHIQHRLTINDYLVMILGTIGSGAISSLFRDLLDDNGAEFVDRKSIGIFAKILIATDSRADVQFGCS